jgi:surface protein
MSNKKRMSNTNTSNARKVQKTTNRKKNIIKVRRAGGITLKAAAHAEIGDTEFIDGELYTIRSETQLRNLIKKGRYVDAARTCTSFITDMSAMFKWELKFNDPIGHWDTACVTNMDQMFYFAEAFNQDISRWSTAQVTSMQHMFHHAEAFNKPLNGWNTSQVTNMNGMFSSATSFNQDISQWNVSQVTTMKRMFSFAKSFNQDISQWNVKVQDWDSHKSMFQGTSMSVKRLKKISSLWGKPFHTPSKAKRKKQKGYITDWTTESYRNIQDARRKGNTIRNNRKKIDRHLAQYFRNTPIRAPYIPKALSIRSLWEKNRMQKRVKYLYRGIHGPLAETFIRDGKLHDKGYIAFSRRREIANKFAGGNKQTGSNNSNNSNNTSDREYPGYIMLRLDINSIPRGTPWLWYDIKIHGKGTNAHRSNAHEYEVLLPPGTLAKINSNRTPGYECFIVKYTPDLHATSIDGKRLHRVRSALRTNAPRNTRQARKNVFTPVNNVTAWFSRLFS